MKKTKASLRWPGGDSTSATTTMRENRNGAASRKKGGPAGKLSLPNGSRRKSSAKTHRGARRPRLSHKKELDHATQRYADLYDFAPIGYVSFDRSGRLAEINLTAAQLFGLPRQSLVGMPFAVFVFREDLTLFLHHLLRCRAPDARVETELRLKSSKRKVIQAQLSSTPIVASPHNGAVLFQTSIVDLTERKAAEAALREKEAELELIVTQTPFMLTRCTRDLRYRYVSRAYAEAVGCRPEEIAGKTIAEILGKPGLKKISPHIEQTLKGRTVEFEAELSYPGAGARFVHCVYTPDRDRKGNVIGWFSSITDITRRKKAEAGLQKAKELLEKRVRQRTSELHEINKELQEAIERRKGLEGEILSVSDREQQRLGQELHDGLCQHLTAVAFMARSMALRLRNHRVIDAADIEKIAELVNSAATDTRNLSRALHRVDVDAAGLVNTLQDLVDREIWRIPCRLEVKPSFHVDDEMAAAQIYCIARELVINANKHAQAREVVVKLEQTRQGIVLHVIDDGVGISDEPKLRRGLGFHIMNYRAQLMDGRLEIHCPKHGGTRVSCYLPNRPLPGKSPVAANQNSRHLARHPAAIPVKVKNDSRKIDTQRRLPSRETRRS